MFVIHAASTNKDYNPARMASSSHETQPTNPFVLRIHATENLRPYLPIIERTSRGAIVRTATVLSLTDFSVDIFDEPKGAIPEYGIGGFADIAYIHERIVMSAAIYLDPFSPHREKAMRERLERAIAHELDHLKRMQYFWKPSTLLDAVAFEGLAEHFEIEMTGGEPSLEVTALSSLQVQELLARAGNELTKEDFLQKWEAWYFGSEEEGIPRWTVYSLGFYVVGEYLKAHPDQKPSTLTAMPAEAFIS
ncbi:MAG: hypothetical protein HYV40_02335 [Candidatus Levybacteria bacterium]|nr:hypothetical protein [Candidatus Levybacteria bacterium]